jgi:hypothetical protein
MKTSVRDVPLEAFKSLQANDVLFIDSSHVVSIDSDVVFEILELLPLLASGVVVHFHDMFIPFDYPEKFVIGNLCFWGEQYLLQAFLMFNGNFETLWSGSAMQYYQHDLLEKAFPGWRGSYLRVPKTLTTFTPTLDGQNVWPCSLWIRRK